MNPTLGHRGYPCPPGIIAHAVWFYHRFTLSLRDVEDLLAERGIPSLTKPSASGVPSSVCSMHAESGKPTVRAAIAGFSMKSPSLFMANADTCSVPWTKTEMSLMSMFGKGKDTRAAKRFFVKRLTSQGHLPHELTIDRLGGYRAAKRQIISSVPHCQDQYANN